MNSESSGLESDVDSDTSGSIPDVGGSSDSDSGDWGEALGEGLGATSDVVGNAGSSIGSEDEREWREKLKQELKKGIFRE